MTAEKTSSREILARRMWLFHNSGKPFDIAIYGPDADCFLEDLAAHGYKILPLDWTQEMCEAAVASLGSDDDRAPAGIAEDVWRAAWTAGK
jgi:hypothetical protein